MGCGSPVPLDMSTTWEQKDCKRQREKPVVIFSTSNDRNATPLNTSNVANDIILNIYNISKHAHMRRVKSHWVHPQKKTTGNLMILKERISLS